jgi:hypothetical protein
MGMVRYRAAVHASRCGSLATLICWNERDFDAVVIIIGTKAQACAWPIEQGWQSKREALEGIAAERRADGFDEHPSICEV